MMDIGLVFPLWQSPIDREGRRHTPRRLNPAERFLRSRGVIRRLRSQGPRRRETRNGFARNRYMSIIRELTDRA